MLHICDYIILLSFSIKPLEELSLSWWWWWWWDAPMRKPALDYSSTGVKCYSLAEKIQAAHSFVPSTMAPRRDCESHREILFTWCMSSTIAPCPLPQPRKGSLKKRQPFDLKRTQGSIFQGDNALRPHTQCTWVWRPGGSSRLCSPSFTAHL